MSQRPQEYATYELHDGAGQRTSVLFAARHNEFASDSAGCAIFPAVQNFYLPPEPRVWVRARPVGRPTTRTAARGAIGSPTRVLAGPSSSAGLGALRSVRRRRCDVVFHNRWDPARAIVYGAGARRGRRLNPTNR